MNPNSNIAFHTKIDESLPKEYAELYKAERSYLQMNINKDALICDIGCGEGRSIDDLLDNTQNIIGVDYDPDCIQRLNQKYKDSSTLKFICADCSSLPFKDGSFDGVICMMSWLNFGDKKNASLEEMKRILRPNGNIILSVFSEDALPIRLETYKKIGIKIKEIVGGTIIFNENFGANTSEQFTLNELKIHFINHQLNIKEIKKIGIGYICNLTKSL